MRKQRCFTSLNMTAGYEILTRPFSNEIRLLAWEKLFEDFGAEIDL